MGLAFKKHGRNHEINAVSKGGKSYYTNIIDRDANKLAQIFIDLHFEGYPIEKAFKLMQERLKKKDWFGL